MHFRGTPASNETTPDEPTWEGSRLQREAAFRESMTDAERRWLREHRPSQAAHWNMLSTITNMNIDTDNTRGARLKSQTVYVRWQSTGAMRGL
jgi:hypothetical protein